MTFDGGKTWREAALEEPILDRCLTRFRTVWDWNGGPAKIASRAVDSTGYVQPTVAEIAKARALAGRAASQWHFPVVDQCRRGGEECGGMISRQRAHKLRERVPGAAQQRRHLSALLRCLLGEVLRLRDRRIPVAP